jgi:hypothetical protein
MSLPTRGDAVDDKLILRTTELKQQIDEVIDGGDARDRIHELIDVFATEVARANQEQVVGRFIYELPSPQREQFIHFVRKVTLPEPDYFQRAPRVVRWLDTMRPLLAGLAGLGAYIYLAIAVFALSFDRVRSFVVEMVVLGAAAYVCWMFARLLERRIPRDPSEFDAFR